MTSSEWQVIIGLLAWTFIMTCWGAIAIALKRRRRRARGDGAGPAQPSG